MKKSVLFVAAIVTLLLCASCAKKNTFSGHLDGLEGDSIKVQVYDYNNSRTAIETFTVPVTNGDIAFDYADSTVRWIRISEISEEQAPKGANMVYVPGERAVLSGRLDSLVLDGTQFYKDKLEYEKICAEDQKKLQAITAEYRQVASSEAADAEAKADSITNVYNEVSKHVTELTKDFVKNNPVSLYAATLVSRLIGEDGKDALEALEAMPESVKNGVVKPIVERTQKSAVRAKARSEAAEKVKDGMQAPDFTLKNEKGEDFTLSSIYNQGKYIILDFWGDWCYWCKKGIPDMKQLYKDAKGKIEILSVDCGDKEDVWKNSIKENELPWLHVYNPGEENADLAVTYAIQGYPTKIILNPDGTINKTIVGEDPEFYTYVKSLIKK